jgi:hypothetical protein
MTDQPVARTPVGFPPQPLDRPTFDRPLQEVVVELWENAEKLLRQEVALASSELDQKINRLKRELVGAAIGGAVLHAGVLALVAALTLLLSKALEPYLAAFIVAVAAGVVGIVLLSRSKPDVQELVPERSIESLKKDVQTFTEAKP